MIKQIKTKNKVLVDPVNQVEEYVVLTLKSVDYHGDVFHASSEYSILGGQAFKQASASFTKEEADQLFTMFAPTGTFTEIYDQLAVNTMMMRVASEEFFGLNASDWEDYVPVVEIPTE